MTEIILVRHGQTAWNASEVFRGQIDIDLDETGVKQADLLGRHLSRRHLEAIYTSPLRRAVQTAEAIAGHQQGELAVLSGLIDMDFGEWQGLTLSRVRGLYPELYEKWEASPHLFRAPSGESLHDVHRRAWPAIEKVVAQHVGTVVLVSHRVVNKVLILALLGRDNAAFWNIRMDTAAMTIFIHENGRYVLVRHNDTSFLGGEGGSEAIDF